MQWLITVPLTIVVALQSWILLEIIKLKIKTAEYRFQIGRLVSDIESEKGTRLRLHADFESRLRRLENKR